MDNAKIKSIKILIGLFYFMLLLFFLYLFFSKYSLEEITTYKFIQSNREYLINIKESNIFLLSIVFIVFTIVWIFMLGFGSPVVLLAGFIFGKWLGTLILIFGNTLGGLLLYQLAKTFFSELIEKKFTTKFSKFIEFFNKNETIYFMCFRFIGGGGTPFPIQNVLPVLFNMSAKNYVIATLLGIIPTTFVAVALGSGIEKIIDQNAKLSFLPVIQSPEIYLPIIGFFIILIFAFFLKKYLPFI